MLLLFVTVSSFFIGSFAGHENESKCYGDSLRFPFDYTPSVFRGKIYFTPSNGGSRKLLMDNGEAKDPRLSVSYASVTLRDLRERDQGTFSISVGDRLYDIITLTINDCAKEFVHDYATVHYGSIPRKAEYLEFTPLYYRDQPQILWNRTDPQTNKGGRVQVRGNTWEMYKLTQADNGFYAFRKNDDTLLNRIQLSIQ
ncbi:uncharacterized protein AKAME5_002836000, partial [Lates japonicus]